jgi:hypothetical protein
MDSSKGTLFQYFDPQWLRELSYSDGETLQRVIDAFLCHVPAMIDDVQLAVNQGSTTRLTEAIRKVTAVASLFTRKDLSHRFLSLKSSEEGPISPYTMVQVNSILIGLGTLQNEVEIYRNLELNSQLGSVLKSNIRDN